MLSSFPLWLASAPPVQRPRPSLEKIRARIAALNPDLAWGSATSNAAIILLAGEALSHNVDRLARFTGISREEVARCARRLVDNGVWRDGNTVGHWVDDENDAESFLADVGVAEGVLCRRMGDDGQLEWAPQGYWRKHYEYAGPREEEQPQVVSYHPHVEMPPQDVLYVPTEDEGEDEDEDGTPAVEPRVHRPEVVATVPDSPAPAVWLGGDDSPAEAEEHWREATVIVGPQLFPEAVWLG